MPRSASPPRRVSGHLVALPVALVALLGGCSAPVAPGGGQTPSPAPTPVVLEDAGVETPLRPGTYVSRLFEPALRLELGTGWFRRDANDSRRLDVRHGATGAEAMTFYAGIDFLQCGTGDLVRDPDAATVAAAIRAMPLLNAPDLLAVPIGERTGTEIRLAGEGEPVPEEDFPTRNEYGCILSFGEVPFPAESAWLFMLRDTVLQVVLVDVGATTVVIAGRTDERDGVFFDTVLDVLAASSIG